MHQMPPEGTREFIREVVRETVREVVKETVRETFVSLGLDINDRVEVQKDFQSLREWRETTNAIKRKGILVVVGTVLSGALAAIWLGVKELLAR